MRTRTLKRLIGWSACLVLGGMAVPASAQLIGDRFGGLPTETAIGVGRVRLVGMGGFLTAVPDENQEISLYDFSGNPAGFGDDRDAWSIDMRYSHTEYVEGPTSLDGNDIKLNDGTFVLGFHNPGKFGIGGTIDYSEAATRDISATQEAYQIAGFNLTSSLYLFPKIVAGLKVGYAGETQDVSSSSFYSIEHDSSVPYVSGGVGIHPVTGVTLGVRGDAYAGTIDGVSQSSTHEDHFTWDRPASSWSVHGFIDRARLEAGADYTHGTVEGRESVKISWSERFAWNPSPNTLNDETDTFSEDRSADAFRARVRLDVIPRRLSVSGTIATLDEEFSILSNPNAIGSLNRSSAEGSRDAWLIGAAYSLFQDRLLVAAEAGKSSGEFLREGPTFKSRESNDVALVRAGGEYFLGETLALRAGLIREDENRTTDVAEGAEAAYVNDPALTGSFDTWRLATGIGLVPWGGIWEFDLAYEVTLESQLHDDLSHFAAYVRYLF